MGPKLQAPWAELLEYYRGIGYGDLYLTAPPAGARQATAPPAGAREMKAPPAEARGMKAPPPAPVTQERQSESGRGNPVSRPLAENVVAPQSMPQVDSADPSSRRQQFEQLAAEAAQCMKCALSQGRRNVVFGSGNPEADLMFVGEGPGAQEDLQGLPFVGPAGALLTRIIAAIDIQREDVYICNVVKCRPPNNRDPLPEEVSACRSFLERQIDLVRPKVIVALGRVAAQALLGTNESLGRLRGRWHRVRDVPTRATYHPAALLRYAKWKRPTWEDMQIVRDFLRNQPADSMP